VQLRRPVLFDHGTADPFGTLDELRSALALIPGAKRLVPIESAGHDLKRGRFDVAATITGLMAMMRDSA
jgi:predicted alpha/beta-hydrolase family hydrolase